jgi:hypothetical protein
MLPLASLRDYGLNAATLAKYGNCAMVRTIEGFTCGFREANNDISCHIDLLPFFNSKGQTRPIPPLRSLSLTPHNLMLPSPPRTTL